MITMEKQPTSLTGKLGRPLSFDRDVALRSAMLLFWKHGYEGASVAELVSVMGITPPSLYAAFGDKKRLFLEAVDLYRSGSVAGVFATDQIMDQAATAEDAARQMLEAAAHHFTGPDTPNGCLLSSGAITCSAAGADVQAIMTGIRQQIEARLNDMILADIAADRLHEDTDAGLLAAYVMAVIQGMATLARDGASRAKLSQLARTVMLSWPSADH